MPIITTPSGHKFPWYVKLFFLNKKRKYGAILEPIRYGKTERRDVR